MNATAPSDWRVYHGQNPRAAHLAALWARPLVAHLRGLPLLDRGCAVLDFGCGYFDVGLAVADRAGRVDGVDIEPGARAVARARAATVPNARVFDGAADLPRGAYDLIVAGSVFQYLGSDAGVAGALDLFRDLLNPRGRGAALLVDLIPPVYSPALDAGRSLWVAARGGVLGSMLCFLGKTALTGGAGALHRIAPDRIAELAAGAGFGCERLPVNLTPSRRRYTCALRRPPTAPVTSPL